jgi:hypothetical protein
MILSRWNRGFAVCDGTGEVAIIIEGLSRIETRREAFAFEGGKE